MNEQLNKLIDLDSLPKNQARVEIAKDVLASVKIGKLQPDHIYCDLYGVKKGDLRTQIPNLRCNVCAVGAMFLADIARRNKYSVTPYSESSVTKGDYWNCGRSKVLHRLRDFFSDAQLDLIETHYEYEWFQEIPDDELRMNAIMENIIKNKGTFKPKPRIY